MSSFFAEEEISDPADRRLGVSQSRLHLEPRASNAAAPVCTPAFLQQRWSLAANENKMIAGLLVRQSLFCSEWGQNESSLSNNQSVSVSVALLFLRFGSVTPLGELTVAVSARESVADALIVPVAL
jgi:hypothetical protein